MSTKRKRKHIPISIRRQVAAEQYGMCPCGLVILGRSDLDHWLPLEDGGTDELDNLVFRHVRCHLPKTVRENVARAKARRIKRKREGNWPKKGRKLRSRGFDKRYRKKFDGTVEKRDG